MTDHSSIPWERISHDAQFLAAIRAKARLVTRLSLIAALYYFALPLGASWLKPLFTLYLAGDLNLGLVFAVSQYPVGALLAYAYVRGIRRINDDLQAVRERHMAVRP